MVEHAFKRGAIATQKTIESLPEGIDTLSMYSSLDEEAVNRYATLLSAGSFVSAYFMLAQRFDSFPTSPEVVVGGALGAGALFVKDRVVDRRLKKRLRVIEKTHEFESHLGYAALDVVYEGKNQVVPKGGRVLYVLLPNLESSVAEKNLTANPKFLRGRNELIAATLSDVSRVVESSEKPYDAIYVNYTNTTMQGQQAEIVNSSELVSGKNIISPRQNKVEQGILFNAHELKAFAKTENDVFMEGVNILASDMVKELVELAKKTGNTEEKKRVVSMLERQLHGILKQQCELQFNDPQSAFSRKGGYVPVREKQYSSLTLVARTTGTYAVRFISQDGSIQEKSLEQLLAVQDMSFDEMIAEKHSYQKGRAAYALLSMLQKDGYEAIMQEKSLNSRRAKQMIEEAGGKVIPAEIDDIIDILYSELRTKFGMARKIKDRIGASAMSIVLFSSVASLFSAGVDTQDLEAAGQFLAKHSPVQLEGKNKSLQDYKIGQIEDWRAPGRVPASQIDWKVEASSQEIDPSGYYIISTGNSLTNEGNWIVNGGKIEAIHVPKKIAYDQAHITLEARMPGDTFSFNIPVRDGTTLGALQVTNEKGEEVKIIPWIRPDNTISVTVTSNAGRYFDVSAKLIESSESPKASREFVSAIDKGKLSPQAFELLEQVDPSNFHESLAKVIKNSFIYSIRENPKLKNAKTPEEIINAIVDSETCQCSTCNTLLVLLSAMHVHEHEIHNQESEFTSYATGYMLNIQGNPASSSDTHFLRNEYRHAFGVTNNGQVMDGTAQEIAGDKETVSYMELLRRSTSDPDQAWEKQKESVVNQEGKYNKEKYTLLAAGLLASSGLSYFGLRKLYPLLRRKIESQGGLKSVWDDKITSKVDWVDGQVNRYFDSKLLEQFSADDVKKVYEFFQNVSWSNLNGAQIHSISGVPTDKEELWEAMKKHININKVVQYLEAPKILEEGLTSEEVVMMRVFANRLVV